MCLFYTDKNWGIKNFRGNVVFIQSVKPAAFNASHLLDNTGVLKDKKQVLQRNHLNFKNNKATVSAQQALVYFTSSKASQLKGLADRVNPEMLEKHVRYLASDDLAGRLPGTEGAREARDYIVNEFKKAGLIPLKELTDDGYVQKAVYQMAYHECTLNKQSGKFEKLNNDSALTFNKGKLELDNIIGYIPSKNNSEQYVFVTAHYDHLGRNVDTGKIYTGADDNASGIAALIESARILSKTNPDKNIVFVATSGEEMGLLGASYLAKQMVLNGFKGKAQVLNMDCLAAKGDFMTIEGGGPTMNRHLSSVATRMADKLNINYDTPPKNDRTDAQAFEKAGIPAITFLWAWMNDGSNRQHYHQPSDRPEIADYNNLYTSTKLAVETINELSKA